MAHVLVAHLKGCAIALAKQGDKLPPDEAAPAQNGTRPKVDKSLLAIPEIKRIRSKEHLRFVASKPCVVCGRNPAHAHHLRHAQPRGLGLKVSDEFTVPLCATHHRDIHQTTREREWWGDRKIEPMAVAAELWRESSGKPLPSGVTELATAASEADVASGEASKGRPAP